VDYSKRTAEFALRLDRAGLSAYWLVEAANVRYLSGFTGEDSTLLVTPERSTLVTDSRYAEQAADEAHVDEVVSRHTPMAQAVGVLCKAQGVKRVGVTAANVTHADFVAAAVAAEGVEMISRKAGIAEEMRARKDADEVAAIRAALRLAEGAFLDFLSQVEPGRSEKWLAARLDYEMRIRGADGASFETICATGAHASMPHAVSGAAEVEADSAVLFDWGARLDGYCSDLTRVVGVGTIPRNLGTLVDALLEAQDAVFGKLRPGNRCGEADAAGRAVLAKAGQGRYFGHGIGHGVGLAVHELPRVGPDGETVLLPGMVVTVEPGIYVPGAIGARIEEMVLITPDGHEVLTSLPKRPEELSWSGS
jgi:Xaa-Pro aminopeptidase